MGELRNKSTSGGRIIVKAEIALGYDFDPVDLSLLQ